MIFTSSLCQCCLAKPVHSIDVRSFGQQHLLCIKTNELVRFWKWLQKAYLVKNKQYKNYSWVVSNKFTSTNFDRKLSGILIASFSLRVLSSSIWLFLAGIDLNSFTVHLYLYVFHCFLAIQIRSYAFEFKFSDVVSNPHANAFAIAGCILLQSTITFAEI